MLRIVVNTAQPMLFRAAYQCSVGVELMKTVVGIAGQEMLKIKEQPHSDHGNSAATSGSSWSDENSSRRDGYFTQVSRISRAVSRR